MTFCLILTLHSIPWTFRVSATSYIARTFCHLMLVAGSDPLSCPGCSQYRFVCHILSSWASTLFCLPVFNIHIGAQIKKDKIVDIVTIISTIVSSSQPFVSLLMSVTYFMLLQVGQNVSSASPLPVSVSYRQHK